MSVKSFLLAGLLGLMSVSAFAEDCAPHFMMSPARQRLRDDLTQLADEVQAVRQAEQPVSPWSKEPRALPQWPREHRFKSPYIFKHLSRSASVLDEALAEAEHKAVRAAGLRSAELVRRYLQKTLSRFERDGISYEDFLRLSYLVSQQLTFFVEEKRFGELFTKTYLNEFSSGKDNGRPLTQDFFNRPIAAPVFAKEREITEYLRSPGIPYLDGDINEKMPHASSFKFRHDMAIFIPTFANLGFETLLWALSRGVLLLGQSRGVMSVDGYNISPEYFFAHDVLHGEYMYEWMSKPGSAVRASAFWDWLHSLVKVKATSVRHYKLMMVILFDMFHEEGAEVGCAGIKQFKLQPIATFASVQRWKMRLGSDRDLGQAFAPDYPTEDEIQAANGTLAAIAQLACRP